MADVSHGEAELDALLDAYADQIVRVAPEFSEARRARIAAVLNGSASGERIAS